MKLLVNFLIFLFFASPLYAQPDSLRQLPEVDITAARLSEFGVGYQPKVLDSLDLHGSGSSSLADVLAKNGIGDLRFYGPGGLASISLHGGSASQTSVLWEGIPLQSPMNGVADLAQLPAPLLGRVSVLGGASGAMMGNATIGGVIHISSDSWVKAGHHIEVNSGLGQYGLDWQGVNAKYSKYSTHRFQSSTKFIRRQSANRFTYREAGREEVLTRQHSDFQQFGIMQQLMWKPSIRHQWSMNVWAGTFFRNLYPSASQEDRFLRGSLSYAGWWGEWKIRGRSGLNLEDLHYADLASSLDVLHRTNGWFSEVAGRRELNRRNSVEISFQHMLTQANSPQLDRTNRRSMPGVLVSWKRTWGDDMNWMTACSVRKDWPTGEAAPFMPGAGLEGEILPGVMMFARMDRSFRLPTLNDRYWLPGGNPDLKPETGVQGQLGFSGKLSRITWRFNGYGGRTQNWILWRPQGNFWTPLNVREVEVMGAEVRLDRSWELPLGLLEADFSYTWNSSEAIKSDIARDAAVGRQLIYVPRHKASGSLTWSYLDWRMSYHHLWTGNRNITSDGEYQLPSFFLAHLDLSTTIKILRSDATLHLNADNLWNVSYQSVAGQPMPLRTLQVGISFSLSTP
ncbi:MAG: TonB-dependent receptor [Bacteroidia bacterium]|nr:TonB-dependent receptor [Bacteroidia bacterium]